MASFDFIEASTKGYDFVWRERSYLARVAVPVLFVKVACLLAVVVFGAQEQYLRQGLILIPGHIVEAIFVIGLIRYVLYIEPIFIWGKLVPMPESDTKPVPYHGFMSKKKCMQGGLAMYLLIKIIAIGIAGGMLDYAQSIQDIPPAHAEPVSQGVALIIMLGVLASIVWVFRLFWLYIPVAMGYSFVGFLKRIAGVKNSVCMVATWFVCFLPLMVFLVAVIQFFTGILVDGSAMHIIATSVFEGIAEIIMLSVQVVAMTYGISSIFSNSAPK